MINNKHYRLIRYLVMAAFVFLFTQNSNILNTEAKTSLNDKKIMIVYSSNIQTPGNKLISSGLLPVLYNSGFKTTNINIEYMDIQKNTSKRYVDEFKNYLKVKYADTTIDLIICITTDSLKFFNNEGRDLFKEAPVISITAGEILIKDYGSRDTLFLTSAYDIKNTVTSALKMLPDTKQILIVNGSMNTERAVEPQIENDMSIFKDKVKVTFLKDMSFEQIIKKVSAPLPDTIILYITFFKDVNNKAYVPKEAAAAIASKSTVPVFCLYDSLVDTGCVGGSMFSFENEGRTAGIYAVKILSGKYKVKGTMKLYPKFSSIYDYRQIKKWNISEEAVPKGSILMHKDMSFYEKYRVIIFSVILVFIVMLGLIIGLLINIYKRRIIETEMMKLNNDLEVIVDERTQELAELNSSLEGMVLERTSQLEETNVVLEETIEEQRRIEVDLIKAKIDAENANKAKSIFLANMSHEIRTPLHGLMGMIELAILNSENDEQQGNLITAKQSSNYLLDIINNILDYSKIEANGVSVVINEFSLREHIMEVVEFFKITAEEKGLTIGTDIDEAVPELIRGDSVILNRILLNLIGNAVKFTEKGKIDVSAEVKSQNENIIELLFKVTDTGIGIPEDKISLLFQRFQQLDSTYSKQYQGTGLGLAICRKLVEALNGDIWVESIEGKGSSFMFIISFEKVS